MATTKPTALSQLTPLLPSELPTIIKNHIKMCEKGYIQLTPMFWGPPGIGKSQIIAQACADMGYELIDFRVTMYDAVDVRGIPYRSEDGVRWELPNMFPRNPDAKVVILFDELAQGTQSVQTALFQLLTDRKIGDYTLPKNVILLAAGNRAEDRSGSKVMLAAMQSRLRHFELTVSVDEWLEHGFAVGYHPLMLAYIKNHPNELLVVDVNERYGTRSPRTWGQAVNPILQIDEESPMLPKIFEAEITSAIGNAAANGFINWLKVRTKLPNLDEIAKSGKSNKLDSTDKEYINVSYIACMGIAARMRDMNAKVKSLKGTPSFEEAEKKNYETQNQFFMWMNDNVKKPIFLYVLRQYIGAMKQTVITTKVPSAHAIMTELARQVTFMRE